MFDPMEIIRQEAEDKAIPHYILRQMKVDAERGKEILGTLKEILAILKDRGRQ